MLDTPEKFPAKGWQLFAKTPKLGKIFFIFAARVIIILGHNKHLHREVKFNYSLNASLTNSYRQFKTSLPTLLNGSPGQSITSVVIRIVAMALDLMPYYLMHGGLG